jgi:hypothetical protein
MQAENNAKISTGRNFFIGKVVYRYKKGVLFRLLSVLIRLKKDMEIIFLLRERQEPA